jgi:ankyrin repeat protein
MEPILGTNELVLPLLAAARGSQEEIVTMILDSGKDAIRSKEMEILESAEDTRIEDSPVKQALLHASRAGHIGIVRKLLDLTPTFGERYLLRPLLASIEGNHEQVALMLLDAGADPSSECVSAALNIKNFELVNSLLEADPNLRNDGLDTSKGSPGDHYHYLEPCQHSLLVFRATHLGVYSIIERIISHGALVNEFCPYDESGTALIVAVRKQDIKLVQLLLDRGADVNLCAGYPGRVTPLAAAVMQGDVSMTEFLLGRGANSADAKALCEGMLHSALLTEQLFEAFAKQHPHGMKGFGSEVLNSAIEVGNLDIIRKILLLPADLHDFITSRGGWERRTPLGSAIMKDQGKHLEMVQMFLEAGSDIDITDHVRAILPSSDLFITISETALLVAVETGNLQMVHLLVNYGAMVNRPATMGVKRTPLQKAVEIGSFDIAQYLLSHGAEINALPARSGGATALQLAAIGGYIGIAELLLNSGANPNAAAAKVNGRTAIEGAAEYGRIDMLRLLTNAGAKMERRQFEKAAFLAARNGHVATKKYLESLYHETVSIEELLS